MEQKKFVKLFENQIKDLKKSCERLCINDNNWRKLNSNLLDKIRKKIEKKGIDNLSVKEKICLSEYFEIIYYEGKLMAYSYVLKMFNGGLDKKEIDEYPNYYNYVIEMNNILEKKQISCEHLKKQNWNKGDNNLIKTYE